MTEVDPMNSGDFGPAIRSLPITRLVDLVASERLDHLIVEEPLEIRLGWRVNGQLVYRSISMTMRTPGADEELVIGFLFNEGIIGGLSDITSLKITTRHAQYSGHQAEVILRDGLTPDPSQLSRQPVTNSSCGVCAKTSVDDLRVFAQESSHSQDNWMVQFSTLSQLSAAQRASQNYFELTGGVHATSLFEKDGRLIDTAEDVGRHNAFDKIVGRAVMRGQIPLRDKIVVVSGRASFELVQKAASAGAKLLCAVGAPSSMAVDNAAAAGITLVGFLRNDRLNIYTHAQRIQ
jgi:FdhD protein